MADPLEWHNVAPQAKYGMTQADAYGAAVNRMYAIIHERQAKEVSNIKLWYYRKAGGKAPFVPTVETFKRDAKWRLGPASERQLKLLSKLGVSWVSPGFLLSSTKPNIFLLGWLVMCGSARHIARQAVVQESSVQDNRQALAEVLGRAAVC